MGCERIFAPSLTLTLQAQRFFLAASARSFLVTALERLKSKRSDVCTLCLCVVAETTVIVM